MKKPYILLFLLSSLFGITASAQTVTVKVSNNGGEQRHELAELPLADVEKKLTLKAGETFIVRNARGQEVGCQKTYDGKLLIDASVRPHGTAVFTIEKGVPQKPVPYVFGRQYPERIDDFAWENDKAMWRLYGPALQARKERSFGVDIWVKNTPELVLEKRYALALSGQPRIDSLRRLGKYKEADDLEPITSFHFDHGDGLDCYNVGATLGGGVPAIILNGEMIMPYSYKTYRILDNGPLRLTVEFTYCPTDMGSNKGVVEYRIISLDKGSNYTSMTVWYEGLKSGADLAAGFVIHKEDTESIVLEKDYAAYADPTDSQDRQNSQIYVGVIFPNGVEKVEMRPHTGVNGVTGHALGIRHINNNEKYTYLFGSSWSKYDIHTFAEWKLRTEETLHNMKNPMKAEIE
ncbi:MAG: DUF4861 family protein [Bacteroidaceae bacterium]|nr:DUF4861 family protein [Bacteroidaceae bacterium]